MSVVAGLALMDGALLAADCRVTLRDPDRTSDTVQKLFSLAPGTAIGFVAADGRVAGEMLRAALGCVGTLKHRDTFSLLRWLPRFFQREYSGRVANPVGREVEFMVAFSQHDRPSIVDRQKLQWVLGAVCGEGKSGHLPKRFFEIMFTPGGRHIAVRGTPYNGLYTMKSPLFDPVVYPPLSFAVIGSGRPAGHEINEVMPYIVGQQLGEGPFVEEMMFRQAIQEYLVNEGVASVGGLIPMLRLVGRKTTYVGMDAEIPIPGTKFELRFEAGRWLQENMATGKKVLLQAPWDIDPQAHDGRAFEDVVAAFRNVRGKGRPYWWGQGSHHHHEEAQ